MKGRAALACLVLQARSAAGFVAPAAAGRARVQSAAARSGINSATAAAAAAATSAGRSLGGSRGSLLLMAAPEDTPEAPEGYTLVVVRHGESTWNNENKFTGWVDVPLSEKGVEEAKQAGDLIAESGLTFDVAYTSVLKRAINTLWSVLEKTDLMWIPVVRTWRLNERHYGALQGLDKKATVEKHGMDQVMIWRRSYTTPPPLLDDDSKDLPQYDRKYAGVDPAELPRAESLKLTKDRFLVEWESDIAPAIKSGKRVLIVAHGNTIRGLCQHLDEISDDEITGLDIPTGVPLVYTLDKDLKPVKHEEAIPPLSARYLGDVSELREKIEKVKAQTK